MHAQARHLRDLKHKYAARISPRKPLPEEYLRAILKLRHRLNQMAEGPMTRLKEAFCPSPPMRALLCPGRPRVRLFIEDRR